MDRSGVYENVVEATKDTLKQALKDAPAFTNQVLARRLVKTTKATTMQVLASLLFGLDCDKGFRLERVGILLTSPPVPCLLVLCVVLLFS